MIQKPNHAAATPVGRPIAAPTGRLMAAIVAIATLTACQTQLTDPLDNIQPGSHTRTLSVQMPPQQPHTRVAYDDLGLALTWQEGDELTVSNTTTNITNTFALQSGVGTADAIFVGIEPDSPGNTGYVVSHRAAKYANPVPDEKIASTTGAIKQQQTGNNNTDHLRQHLELKIDNTTLNQPISLQLRTSILKLSLHNLPTDLGKLSSLRWMAETAANASDLTTVGTTLNYTLELTGNATPDASGNFTAYIAFDPGYMSVRKGGSFSVTLTADNGTTLKATTTSAQGKAYQYGQRYTASMGNGGAGEPQWERGVTGAATATGLEKLDPNVFNAKNPVWTITGGDGTTETDAKVCANVQAALKALPEGSNIELTMTGVKALGRGAFLACTALKSISLPVAESIGESAFLTCTALKSIDLPMAENIRKLAFNGCTALITVSLPAATYIGESAFNGCAALTAISLPLAAIIGDNAFRNGCIALESIDLPMAESIGRNAFADCSTLATVSLPLAAIIGEMAFSSCPILTTVSLPAATSIGENAFFNCKALATVSLPKATSIWKWAFHNCAALTHLELTAAGSFTLDAKAFDSFNNAANCTLVLHPDKKTADTGTATPKVTADGKKWGPAGSEPTWKAIEYQSAPAVP